MVESQNSSINHIIIYSTSEATTITRRPVTNSYVFQVTVIEPKTITIESQDITAYTGGDSINDDSFPTARYKVTVRKTSPWVKSLSLAKRA